MENRSKDIGELLADDSFIRWLEGVASSGEASYWQNWENGDPHRTRLVDEARQLHNQLQFGVSQNEDLEYELFKLNQQLDKRSVASGARPVLHNLNRKSRRSVAWSAAAVLLVSVMISGLVYVLVSGSVQQVASEFVNVRTETVETDFGETRQISFSDGTIIMLNANSVVTYSLYDSGEMEAELVGEAWFDIPPSANRTVSVHTTDGSVHVLGTKFNVSTYGEGTSVVLQQGSVRLAMAGSEGEVTDEVTIVPGTWATMKIGENAIATQSVDPELYTSWTQNRLRFNETSFTDIETRIRDLYGLEFIVADGSDSLYDIRISGSVPNDNIDVLLNALEGLLGKSATIQGTEIILGEN